MYLNLGTMVFKGWPLGPLGKTLESAMKTLKIRKNIYETNYDRLVKIGIVGEKMPDYRKSKSGSNMDLSVERVPQYDDVSGQNGIAFSLAQYFVQNGDMCQDPEMVVIVYPKMKMVEALTFQQAIPPVYQEVYPEPRKYYPRIKKDLNSFLRTWLNNLIDQGHGKDWKTETD